MSFGFGQNNNQQQNTGFGGFGSNNNNNANTGFGSTPSNNSTFGGSTVFGGNNSTTTGGFGSAAGTGAFGSATTNSSPFGQPQKPLFGSSTTTTSGGGLFGSGTTTAAPSSGFGGFGNTNSNASGSSLFGSTAKPAFGGSTTGGGLFGGGNTQNTGFGATNNQSTGPFGNPTIGGANSTECQGTGSTPFTAYQEKEGNANMTNHYQSISFMGPYKNYSFEELRNADYNQGRRFGNGSGQAGAFGQSNFGGGFGQQQNNTTGFGQPASNTGGGLFGQPAASSSPFGTSQPAQTGFGSGGLFGTQQSKPATGGLFGSASSSQPSTNLFGTAGNTGGAFGTSSTNGTFGTGGGGLFGNNNNNQQQQPKPGFFGSAATTGGFGQTNNAFGSNTTNNNNTGGGLFGNQSAQTSSPFGQTQQQPAQSNPFGGFGQTQNQTQANPSPFGGFGQTPQQDQKAGGLFGQQSNSNTGGGLFGNLGQNNNQQQQPAGGGLFGNTTNNTSTSSLFAPKPATTGGSLFGNNSTSNTNTSGGLFGNLGNNANQTQQNQGGGLFGNNQQNQQKPSLFGNTTNTGGGLFGNLGNNNNQQQGGSSLFGNDSQQQQGGGLFGSTNNNNNQGSSLFGSQQQTQQQPNVFASPPTFNTSLTDPNSAYGSPSIFSGLPEVTVNVGPLATPINVKQKLKKSAILPYYKMAPNAASRLVTPQKRGYGFSYSTYGTPGSASSNASTPGGLSSSLLFGSVGRGLGKSLSTSNLRRSFDTDGDSILTPGAFSAGSSRYGGAGSLKKLTIDRSLRTDLFGDRGTPATLQNTDKNDQSKQPGILKKKVSFDASTVGGNAENQNNGEVNSADSVNGNDLSNSATPSAEEQGYLRTSSRGQGRLGTSKSNGVAQQPEMEQVKGNELAIVHEDESPASSSAPLGKAPSNIPQEDPQPGAYWMKPTEADINRMTQEEKRHVKNYSVGRQGCGHVEFNEPVDLTLAPLNDIFGNIVAIDLRSVSVYPEHNKKPAQGKGLNVPSTLYLENSWPRQRDRKTPLHEKSGPRYQKHVDRLRKVGGTEYVRYERDTGIWVFKVAHFSSYGFDYDEEDDSEGESLQASVLSAAPDTPTPKSRAMRNGRTPTATSSTQRSSASAIESSQYTSSPDDTFQFRKKKMLPGAFDEEPVSENDQEMQEISNVNESFLDERLAVSASDSGEDEPSELEDENGEIEDPSLLIRDEGQDMDIEMAGAFPSPDTNQSVTKTLREVGFGTPAKSMFNVSGDWAVQLQRTISPRKQDRQALRETQARVLEDEDTDQTPNTSVREKAIPRLETSIDLMNSLFGQEQVRRKGQKTKGATKGKKATMSGVAKITPETLTIQRSNTKVSLEHGVPMAQPRKTPFNDIATLVQPDSEYEKSVWQLASILFDDQDPEAYGVPAAHKDKYDHRIRKDRLIAFWEQICDSSAKQAVGEAKDAEERAIAHLTAHKVVDACDALVQGKDFRLATLVAQIGGDEIMRNDMDSQIDAWRELNVLSEMTHPIRTLYSLLAGNTCICEGKKGPAEDQAKTFTISVRFNLDWKRAFGLQLFYATHAEEPIEAAVVKFANDLSSDEPKKPVPPFVENGADSAWDDPAAPQREDILWGLLKLYAASKSSLPMPSIAETFAPQNTTGNPLDARLSFQLYHALILRFPSAPVSAPAQADALAWTFATQLESAGEWLWALFALLHLSDRQQRDRAIHAHIVHHAADIKTESDGGNFQMLTDTFKIPKSWIWDAKALYARSVLQDHVKEVGYLVKAGDWDEAHEVLQREVGPAAVIEEDWEMLEEVLSSFQAGKEEIGQWGLGGQVYEDYLALITQGIDDSEKKELLERLLGALPAMSKREFKQMVAVQEISAVVGKEVLAMKEKVSFSQLHHY
ncbi:nuclear pore complex protein Nup98-Nup96, partial [Lecanoromycetidae sp. Uapishka_2]